MVNEIVFEGNKIAVNDVFVSIWGCEQTNVHFYQVVAVSGKSTVKLREVETWTVQDDNLSLQGKKYAKLNHFKNDEVIVKRLLKNHDKPSVRDDYTVMNKTNPFKGYRFSSYA